MTDKELRLQKANELIVLIATTGRRFFYYGEENRVSHFLFKNNGHIYFKDCYTRKEINTSHYRYFSPYFTDGGTMQALVQELADYIRNDEPTSGQRGYGGVYGESWAYPESDMKKIQEKAIEIGFVKAGAANEQ
ncbi:hypothetical protein [Listeria monocytogenes]|uniref:hypothetical protein n=1 Tax=Listeria monocytogenes TaxID=1639 RepID=UPI00148C141E|nr:hypothetical protein [Listeria monocytogenes]EGO5453273.1 hypothetical protein [Listeria monocytogenes]EHX3186500.1 hypothetical protein [Listeria monocytogenes]QJW60486.1 hypothetical protein HNT73_10900 [Listeria monocytogenes]HAA3078594.1 hypothetical protein [Listeria monocytogenes]HAB0715345.1 hypothetical protein [Listeria monocytogenes]